MLRNFRQIENIVSSNSPTQHYYLSSTDSSTPDKHCYTPLRSSTGPPQAVADHHHNHPYQDHHYQNLPPAVTTESGPSTYEWIFRNSSVEENNTAASMPPQVRQFSTQSSGGMQPLMNGGGGGGGNDSGGRSPSPPGEATNYPLEHQTIGAKVILNHFSPEDDVDKIKSVLIGDGAIGKTSLIVSYTTNGYPTEYVPTAFDNYSVIVTIDNRPVRLQLCDTAGQDDFDSLRPLCYPGCDVFMVCFSVVSPTSFLNVKEKWLPELNRHQPDVPVLLVGTQSDLRTDVKVLIELAQDKEEPVSESSAIRLAKQIGAVGYVESSALTQRNLKEVFDQALLAALEAKNNRKPLSNNGLNSANNSNGKSKRKTKTNLNCLADDSFREERKCGWRKFCCFV